MAEKFRPIDKSILDKASRASVSVGSVLLDSATYFSPFWACFIQATQQSNSVREIPFDFVCLFHWRYPIAVTLSSGSNPNFGAPLRISSTT